jgi:hypothetical protein
VLAAPPHADARGQSLAHAAEPPDGVHEALGAEVTGRSRGGIQDAPAFRASSARSAQAEAL